MATGVQNRAADGRSLTFYAVLATKHKRELIDEAVNETLKEMFAEIKGNQQIVVADWQWRSYGVLVTAEVGLQSGLPSVLRKFRMKSNREIPKRFENVRSALDGDSFWTGSFCFVPADDQAEKIIGDYMKSITKMAEEAKQAERR